MKSTKYTGNRESINQILALELLKKGKIDEFEANLGFWDPNDLFFGNSLLYFATFFRSHASYNSIMVRISLMLLKHGAIITPEVCYNLTFWDTPELEVISSFLFIFFSSVENRREEEAAAMNGLTVKMTMKVKELAVKVMEMKMQMKMNDVMNELVTVVKMKMEMKLKIELMNELKMKLKMMKLKIELMNELKMKLKMMKLKIELMRELKMKLKMMKLKIELMRELKMKHNNGFFLTSLANS
jgi:hypothetical protein